MTEVSTRWAPGQRWWRSDALADLLVTTTVLAVAVTVTWHGGVGVTRRLADRPSAAALALAAMSALPLIRRRRNPMAVFGITTGATIVLALLTPIGLPLGPGAALYTVAAMRRPPVSMHRALVPVAVGFTAYLAACAIDVRAFPWSELFHGGLLWAACWFAGERARLQGERLDELRRDALLEGELAATEERSRIARDLHDSAGHAINVIAVRAGAARLRHRDEPDRSLAALTMIEDLARQTAADLDQLVGTLRGAGDADEYVPRSIASVASLAAVHRDAGLPVTVRSHGAARTLSPGVDQAAYRIIQEGLTNASRHGCGAVAVDIDYRETALTISIRNPVTNAAASPVPGRGGHGLAGATERAHLLGGTLRAGSSGGTFRLDASLPYSPPGGTR